jgi:hypothetical protein
MMDEKLLTKTTEATLQMENSYGFGSSLFYAKEDFDGKILITERSRQGKSREDI